MDKKNSNEILEVGKKKYTMKSFDDGIKSLKYVPEKVIRNPIDNLKKSSNENEIRFKETIDNLYNEYVGLSADDRDKVIKDGQYFGNVEISNDVDQDALYAVSQVVKNLQNYDDDRLKFSGNTAPIETFTTQRGGKDTVDSETWVKSVFENSSDHNNTYSNALKILWGTYENLPQQTDINDSRYQFEDYFTNNTNEKFTDYNAYTESIKNYFLDENGEIKNNLTNEDYEKAIAYHGGNDFLNKLKSSYEMLIGSNEQPTSQQSAQRQNVATSQPSDNTKTKTQPESQTEKPFTLQGYSYNNNTYYDKSGTSSPYVLISNNPLNEDYGMVAYQGNKYSLEEFNKLTNGLYNQNVTRDLYKPMISNDLGLPLIDNSYYDVTSGLVDPGISRLLYDNGVYKYSKDGINFTDVTLGSDVNNQGYGFSSEDGYVPVDRTAGLSNDYRTSINYISSLPETQKNQKINDMLSRLAGIDETTFTNNSEHILNYSKNFLETFFKKEQLPNKNKPVKYIKDFAIYLRNDGTYDIKPKTSVQKEVKIAKPVIDWTVANSFKIGGKIKKLQQGSSLDLISKMLPKTEFIKSNNWIFDTNFNFNPNYDSALLSEATVVAEKPKIRKIDTPLTVTSNIDRSNKIDYDKLQKKPTHSPLVDDLISKMLPKTEFIKPTDWKFDTNFNFNIDKNKAVYKEDVVPTQKTTVQTPIIQVKNDALELKKLPNFKINVVSNYNKVNNTGISKDGVSINGLKTDGTTINDPSLPSFEQDHSFDNRIPFDSIVYNSLGGLKKINAFRRQMDKALEVKPTILQNGDIYKTPHLVDLPELNTQPMYSQLSDSALQTAALLDGNNNINQIKFNHDIAKFNNRVSNMGKITDVLNKNNQHRNTIANTNLQNITAHNNNQINTELKYMTAIDNEKLNMFKAIGDDFKNRRDNQDQYNESLNKLEAQYQHYLKTNPNMTEEELLNYNHYNNMMIQLLKTKYSKLNNLTYDEA